MSQRGKRSILLTSGLLGLTLLLVLLPLSPREPSYGGKRLGEWLDGFKYHYHLSADSPEYVHFANAIRHIGPVATPHLMDWITYRPTHTNGRTRIAAVLKFLPESFVPTQVRDWCAGEKQSLRASRAVIAFQVLGTNALPALPQLFRLANDPSDHERAINATRAMYGLGAGAVPTLMKLIQNRNAPARYEAMLGLTGEGTNALPAIPLLITCLEDPDEHIRYGAAEMLGRIGLAPAQCIPALMNCLSNSIVANRCDPNAVKALGRYGAEARAAVPLLRAALTNDNDYVKRLAGEALANVAP